MEPIGSFQGLATGINFRDLVDQIIQADSQPIVRLKQRTVELDRKATAWSDFRFRAQTLYDRSADLSDGSIFDTFLTSVTGMSDRAPLSVSAGSTADPGSFGVKVNQLATREKVAGDAVDDAGTALGYTGEFVIGGRVVTIAATDSLEDVAASLNHANTGGSPSGVGATVVAASGGGYRLVLTAGQTGAEGIDLRDGAGGVLKSMGFLDATAAVRYGTSDGARSATFISSSTAVGALLGLGSAPSGSVSIGGVSVALDLAGDSLDDIATAINDAVAAVTPTPPSISAVVVLETDASGNSVKRLDISGATAFTDANGVLETLGVLEGGRGSVAQAVASASAFTISGGAAAGAATALTDLEVGGTSAGVQAGDTLTVQGTRGDGSAFTLSLTVGTDISTYGDLVDALNAASGGFQAGARTATAAIDTDGRLVVTDDVGGDSRLALSIVANNEGGGALDFGDVGTTTVGRAREVAAGRDAEFEVDGVYFSRSSNAVSGVVMGVTLSLTEATAEEVTVTVDRDVDGVVDGVEAFIKAYNALSEFVNAQFAGSGAEEGSTKRPLSGDSVIRSMRSQLRQVLDETLSSVVTDLSRLSDLGVSLNRTGTYDVDLGVLRNAVESDPTSVQRFFSEYGAGSTGSLEFEYASDATQSGAYDVVVTTVAQQASTEGTGFSGAYLDDGTADTIAVTDADAGSVYSVALSNGMALADIVDALNAEFQTASQRQVQLDGVHDALGGDATSSTALVDLHSSADADFQVATGDTLTLSGTDGDGGSVYLEWVIDDATTQTLGDLRARVADAMGADVDVSIENGALTVTATATGRSSFTLAISSDNAGGGSLDFGAATVVTAGRAATSIRAADSGGQLALSHDDYGLAAGFDVAYTGGGADGTAQLGLAAGSYRGVDVAGTLGGQTAIGVGRTLTGQDGTAAEGLLVRYTGTATGSVGSMRYSRGIAALMEVTTEALVDPISGSIKGISDSLDTQKEGIENRIDRIQGLLDRRYDFLIKRFSALEEAMAKAQQQMNWMQSQLGALANNSR